MSPIALLLSMALACGLCTAVQFGEWCTLDIQWNCSMEQLWSASYGESQLRQCLDIAFAGAFAGNVYVARLPSECWQSLGGQLLRNASAVVNNVMDVSMCGGATRDVFDPLVGLQCSPFGINSWRVRSLSSSVPAATLQYMAELSLITANANHKDSFVAAGVLSVGIMCWMAATLMRKRVVVRDKMTSIQHGFQKLFIVDEAPINAQNSEVPLIEAEPDSNSPPPPDIGL